MNSVTKMYIGGQWVNARSGDTLDVENPATREKIATLPAGDKADIDLAVEAATKGQLEWATFSVQERAGVLERFARLMREKLPEFIHQEVLQTGRAIREMRAQLARLPEWYE